MSEKINTAYLELLKKCLTREIFEDCYQVPPKNTTTFLRALRWYSFSILQSIFSYGDLAIVHTRRPTGETMIGLGAINNLEFCAKTVLEEKIEGDFCETGVWRGGACIFLRAMLEVYDDQNRNVWLADSFEGLPKPDANKYPEDQGSGLWKQSLGVSVDEVKHNFEKYGLLDTRVRFIVGFFRESLIDTPIKKLAVLRLDGDMYESTIVALENLYDKVSIGGYVIIDDYGMIPGCNRAVEEFRECRGISEELEIIGYTKNGPLGAYWRKLSV